MLDCAERFAADLRTVGILPGDTVLVHSSFKSLGRVPGGIETVVQGFLHAIGPDGTLLMPALTWALTITGRPISVAIASASAAEVVTRPGVVGTACLANNSFAWYSKRSIGSLSVGCPVTCRASCDGVAPWGTVYTANRPTRRAHPAPVDPKRDRVIQVTIPGVI